MVYLYGVGKLPNDLLGTFQVLFAHVGFSFRVSSGDALGHCIVGLLKFDKVFRDQFGAHGMLEVEIV